MNANHNNENRRQENRGQRELHRIDDEMMLAEVVFASSDKFDEIRFTDEAQNASEDPVMLIDDLSIESASRSEPTVIDDLVKVEGVLEKDVAVVQYIGATDELEESIEQAGSNELGLERVQTSDLDGGTEFDGQTTASPLPFNFWDKVFFAVAILVGVIGGGVGAWLCYVTSGQAGGYVVGNAWLGSMCGGGIGVIAGAVMATLMLNGYGKYIYNRKGDDWKRTHVIPKSREVGFSNLLQPLLEPGVVIVFLIFAAVGGFVSMAAMNSLPIGAALGFVWLGIPLIGCFLGLTLMLDFEDL